MTYGYYDPRTPGHCALNAREFSKAFGGVLSACVAAWCHYIGVYEVRQALARVRRNPSKWDETPQSAVNAAVAVETWSIDRLRRVCELSLAGVCRGWEPFLGREQVLHDVKRIEEETDWGEREEFAERVVKYFIDLDETEGVQ